LRTDRPTNDLTFGKIQTAISPQGVIRSTSCLVLWWGFRGRRIKWRHFRVWPNSTGMWEKIKREE